MIIHNIDTIVSKIGFKSFLKKVRVVDMINDYL